MGLRRNTVQDKDMGTVWKKYKKTGAKRYRNVLIKHYLPLVKYTAEKLKTRLPESVDVDDLKTAGVFGLMDAIKLFNLKRGFKFATYCLSRVRGSMLDELRAMDWVPRRVRSQSHQLARIHQRLGSQLGRTPTNYEVGKQLGGTLEDCDRMLKNASAINILPFVTRNTKTGNDETVETVHLMKDRESDKPLKDFINHQMVEYVKQHLEQKERLVLELYFYEDLTMKEIGNVLNVSESRVSQIFAQLVSQLRVQFSRYRSEWLSEK